jgi:hypothetical protein
MPLLGQASGGFLESSSALRILYVGVRNSVGVLTDDAFTQTNPPIVTALNTVSTNVDTAVLGVLSGSVAFSRPDGGSNQIGGPAEPAGILDTFVRPLGLFINTAVGNDFENQPGVASGKGPYVSSQGTYASALFETQALALTVGGAAIAAGVALTYVTGQELIASRNGYLMPRIDGSDAITSTDNANASAEVANGLAASTLIAILKMPSDAVQPEHVFDQRI